MNKDSPALSHAISRRSDAPKFAVLNVDYGAAEKIVARETPALGSARLSAEIALSYTRPSPAERSMSIRRNRSKPSRKAAIRARSFGERSSASMNAEQPASSASMS